MLQKVKRYSINVLIAIDQLGNALTVGDPDETISSRIGKVKRANGGIVPWRYPLMRIIDNLLELIDRNHTIEAIEDGDRAD